MPKQPTIKYRITRYPVRPCIQPIEVERETEKSVWLNGERTPKRKGFRWQYYDSWVEAQAALLATFRDDLVRHREGLTRARGYLAMTLQLQPEGRATQATQTLDEYLKGRSCEDFVPVPRYAPEGDCLTVYFTDDRCFAETVNDQLTIYRAEGTEAIVGCKIQCVQHLIDEAVLTTKALVFGGDVNA